MTTNLSENELCNKFIELANGYGFIAHPEFEGWDFLLSKNSIRIGVQAKLQFNAHLIAQCLYQDNVHFKIILLPNLSRLDNDLELIAYELGIMVFTLNQFDQFDFRSFNKNIFYYRKRPNHLITVPKEKFDLPAGVKSPKTLSEYKIALCKLELLAKQNGYLVPYDFHRLGVINIPKYYFRYDYIKRHWVIRREPSKDYPHIWRNINK